MDFKNSTGGFPLPHITAIFWDVGGVLLSDAWDHTQRAQALEKFGVDEPEFQSRHEALVAAFERGEINLDEYLSQTIFYRDRPFTRDAFRDYMFSLSKAKPEMLALAGELAKSGRYLMSTINNESLDLNQYRLQTFGLRDILTIFVSSCFVGLRKPDDGIYRLALQLTQKSPEECCFLDDRAPNLASASRLGMHTIQVQNVDQVRREFEKLEVVA